MSVAELTGADKGESMPDKENQTEKQDGGKKSGEDDGVRRLVLTRPVGDENQNQPATYYGPPLDDWADFVGQIVASVQPAIESVAGALNAARIEEARSRAEAHKALTAERREQFERRERQNIRLTNTIRFVVAALLCPVVFCAVGLLLTHREEWGFKVLQSLGLGALAFVGGAGALNTVRGPRESDRDHRRPQ